MPAYGRFQDVGHYLQARAAEKDTNLTAVSEELNYARSYLNSVAGGQFQPSVQRCREIAAYFDDDPNIILTLAGYREPPSEHGHTAAAVANVVNGLAPGHQNLVLAFAEFMKTRSFRQEASLQESQIYVELPDGRSFTLELDGDLSTVEEPMLRVTLRVALNTALARAE
jgi:hypothetical protein